jgi:hypothetical protein
LDKILPCIATATNNIFLRALSTELLLTGRINFLKPAVPVFIEGNEFVFDEFDDLLICVHQN